VGGEESGLQCASEVGSQKKTPKKNPGKRGQNRDSTSCIRLVFKGFEWIGSFAGVIGGEGPC
jgi:hypothetical protein